MSATVLSETNDVSCSIDFDTLVLRTTYNTTTYYGRIITITTEINMEADTNADNANVIINMIPSRALSSFLLLMSPLVNKPAALDDRAMVYRETGLPAVARSK